jgi:hypothetical protein
MFIVIAGTLILAGLAIGLATGHLQVKIIARPLAEQTR